MSAVGIRQSEIGKALSPHCDVTFAAREAANDEVPGVRIVPCRSRRDFRALLDSHDVLYTLGLNSDRFLDVVRSGIRIVLDLYTPQAFEVMECWPEVPDAIMERHHRRLVRWTLAQLAVADYVVCTTEPQLDLWLGGSLFDNMTLRARQAREASDARGLTDSTVFFITDRVPYRDMGPHLLDANAAVSTYPDSLETRCCLGTRLTDYLWAGLPMVVSGARIQHDFIEGQGLGRCVRPGDPDALARAILGTKRDVEQGAIDPAAFDRARERFGWSAVTEPLVRWLAARVRRGDRARRDVVGAAGSLAEFWFRSLDFRLASRWHGVR